MPQFIPHTPTGKPGTSLPLVRLTVRSEAGEQKFEFRQDAILLGSAAPADIILPDAPALLAVATVVNGGLRLRYIHDTQPVTYLRVREELPLGVCSIRLDFLADTPLSAARSSSHRTGDTELQELRR
ncbi:MAG TPA: hypothetical protein PKD72_15785, partial [Gemmatales bacterium]|nr:hypothetical protein [Gemmatales bacterium]